MNRPLITSRIFLEWSNQTLKCFLNESQVLVLEHRAHYLFWTADSFAVYFRPRLTKNDLMELEYNRHAAPPLRGFKGAGMCRSIQQVAVLLDKIERVWLTLTCILWLYLRLLNFSRLVRPLRNVLNIQMALGKSFPTVEWKALCCVACTLPDKSSPSDCFLRGSY